MEDGKDFFRDVTQKTGFDVPDGYFESFSSELQKKTGHIRVKRIFFKTYILPVSVAASVVIMIFSLAFLGDAEKTIETVVPEERAVLYSQIDDLDIIYYLSSEED